MACCIHTIIDKVKGISKGSVDCEGHEIPAAMDHAGGCPLASMVAGSPFTVAVGRDTDVSTVGVVVVCEVHVDINPTNNFRHCHVVVCISSYCVGCVAETTASHEF